MTLQERLNINCTIKYNSVVTFQTKTNKSLQIRQLFCPKKKKMTVSLYKMHRERSAVWKCISKMLLIIVLNKSERVR